MSYRPTPKSWLFVGICSLICLWFSIAAAQNPQDAGDPWQRAKQAYSQQDWPTAAAYTAAASQRDPAEPRYYLALARIAFQEQRFDDAVWFYDTFLSLAPTTNVPLTGSYTTARADAERKSANERRANSNHDAPEPENQQQVRKALQQRLSEGPIVEDNGGAIAIFETMIRMGYANPDLKDLRAVLDQAAQKEGNAIYQQARGNLPNLSFDAWRVQARRYQATEQIVPAPQRFDDASPLPAVAASHDESRAYRLVAEGQMQYLLENWDEAARIFHEAIEIAPTLVYAHKGQLNAMLSSNNPKVQDIQTALHDYQETAPNQDDIPIYQALVYATTQHADLAAQKLIEILAEPFPSER